MESSSTLFLSLILIFPMAIFLWKLKNIGWSRTTREFFLADKKVSDNEFVDTTVAYGYQIAALSLFAIWGYSYGFWTIWVAIFWCLGFQLLKFLNDKSFLTKYIRSESTFSIHGFLAKRYKSQRLAQLAAIASILGLSGTAFFEAEFTSSVIIAGIGKTQSLSLLLFFLFVLIALVYIVVGGFRAVVVTDKIQLSFGFIAFSIFVVMSYIKLVRGGYVYNGLILFILSFLSVLTLNLLFRRLNGINPQVFPKKYSPTLYLSLLAYVCGAIFILLYLPTSNEVKDSFALFFKEQRVTSIFSLGYFPLISLLLANGLWQIVDISNWQRLASLDDSEQQRKELSKTLSFISIYSPITWIIAIFFGMSLRYTGFDLPNTWAPIQDIAAQSFASTLAFDNIYILVLIFAMVSIMYSTLDSLISSISYTCYYDLMLKGNLEEQAQLSKARKWTVVYTILFFFIYIIVRTYVSRPDDILYTFYAFQLALFPSIGYALVSNRINKLAAFISIIGGSALCITTFVINSDVYNPYSFAAIVSVGGATILFYLFSKFRKFEVSNG